MYISFASSAAFRNMMQQQIEPMDAANVPLVSNHSSFLANPSYKRKQHSCHAS